MPGLMMPQVKCRIRNAVKEISMGTRTAERGGRLGGCLASEVRAPGGSWGQQFGDEEQQLEGEGEDWCSLSSPQ